MATQTAPLQAAWTPEQALAVDHVGNEIYSSHYAERRISRFAIGTLGVLLLGSMGVIASLAHRPTINRYIRIDEMGRAQAIAYTDLSYSPREGEIRTYLTDWANYRYTINRETIAKKYPLNYYFLSSNLASQLMTDDNSNHVVSQVLAGQVEQSEVQSNLITVNSLKLSEVQNGRSYSLVKTVVQVLHDGEKGFADIGEKLKSPELKAFFIKESARRAAFATELEAELALAAGDTKDIGGTAAGAVHRVWGDLKASLGGSDHTLLETAEQGEDVAKKAYKEALEAQDLPSTKIRELLTQQTHIQTSHDTVKAFRDSTS